MDIQIKSGFNVCIRPGKGRKYEKREMDDF